MTNGNDLMSCSNFKDIFSGHPQQNYKYAYMEPVPPGKQPKINSVERVYKVRSHKNILYIYKLLKRRTNFIYMTL